jgi:hypothetical protein
MPSLSPPFSPPLGVVEECLRRAVEREGAIEPWLRRLPQQHGGGLAVWSAEPHLYAKPR